MPPRWFGHVPNDLPMGQYKPQWPSAIVWHTVQQLQQMSPESYRLCTDEEDSRTVERYAWLYGPNSPNDQYRQKAEENGWAYDEEAGRTIPAWRPLQ